MTIDSISEKIALSIQKNNPDSTSSLALLKVGISAVINQLIVTSSVLILGLLTGKTMETVTALIAFPFLRYFCGGLHLRTSVHCNIVTSSLILLSIYIPIGYWYNGIILNIFSIIILSVYAPSGIKRSRLDKKYYPVLKLISIAIVTSNFMFQLPVLSLVFFIQSLTTPRFLQRILDEYKL